MYLTKNNYILLFFLFCGLYYYIINYNVFENFANDEDSIMPGSDSSTSNSHPFIRTDYNELDKPYNSEIHKNLLYNEEDNIKFKICNVSLRTTGMMTDITGHT
jgi:hypothetical protein